MTVLQKALGTLVWLRLCLSGPVSLRAGDAAVARAHSRCALLEDVLRKEHQGGALNHTWEVGLCTLETATGNMVVSQNGTCATSVAARAACGGAGCSLADCISLRQEKAHSSIHLLASNCAASKQWSCGRTWDSVRVMAARGVG